MQSATPARHNPTMISKMVFSMGRQFEMSSRQAVGGLDQPGDSLHGADTRADNVIRFPVLPEQLDGCEETGVACALAVVFSFFAAVIGAGLYLGSLLFDFFDFG